MGTTIGGIVFDPLNENDKIATADDDNIYWNAYVNHGIRDSNREAFERIRRYLFISILKLLYIKV